MHSYLVVILTLLFVWNALLGSMDALVLCLHNDGEAHIELAGGKKSQESDNCAGLDDTIDIYDCASCTDIVLEAADPVPFRPNELSAVNVQSPTVSDTHILSKNAIFPSRSHIESGYLTRAPPDVEPASQSISRTIVLRL